MYIMRGTPGIKHLPTGSSLALFAALVFACAAAAGR